MYNFRLKEIIGDPSKKFNRNIGREEIYRRLEMKEAWRRLWQ